MRMNAERESEDALQRLPDVLRFDPLVNHPDGAWNPWPPLHTLLLAGAGRALGGTQHDLERAGAWLPPLLGALTALPVFAPTLLAGHDIALAALSWRSSRSASPTPSRQRRSPLHGVVLRCGSGVRCSQCVSSGALRIAARALIRSRGSASSSAGAACSTCSSRRRGVGRPRCGAWALRAHAFRLIATALPVALAVPRSAAGGRHLPPFSRVSARTALLALASVVRLCGARALPTDALAGVRARVGRRWPSPRPPLALRAAADAPQRAGYVGKRNNGRRRTEQRPLARQAARMAGCDPLEFGGCGYAIPLVPLITLRRARPRRHEPRARDLVRGLRRYPAAQLRYGNDYAPAAAVGFALCVTRCAARCRASGHSPRRSPRCSERVRSSRSTRGRVSRSRHATPLRSPDPLLAAPAAHPAFRRGRCAA
jgi:hypothetical protein